MAENWNATGAEIAAALREVGMQATLLRKGVATGPEWAPVFGPDTEHTVTVMQEEISLGLVDGETIRASDIRVMMAADGEAPTTADRLRMGGVEYTIARAHPFAPAGVAVYYDVVLRA